MLAKLHSENLILGISPSFYLFAFDLNQGNEEADWVQDFRAWRKGWTKWEHSPECLVAFPGMFGDISRNVWGYSQECLRIFPWLVANSGKSHFLVTRYQKITLKMLHSTVRSSPFEGLFGITIDCELTVDKHIILLCSKANKKLSALI